jgi:hypothetical protein
MSTQNMGTGQQSRTPDAATGAETRRKNRWWPARLLYDRLETTVGDRFLCEGRRRCWVTLVSYGGEQRLGRLAGFESGGGGCGREDGCFAPSVLRIQRALVPPPRKGRCLTGLGSSSFSFFSGSISIYASGVTGSRGPHAWGDRCSTLPRPSTLDGGLPESLRFDRGSPSLNLANRIN